MYVLTYLASQVPRAWALVGSLVLLIAGLVGLATSAVASCVGHCPTVGQPAFTVQVNGGGHVLGANHAFTGRGGTVAASGQTQDFLRMELNLLATGGPEGICPGGCPANNLTATIAAGVLATGQASHQIAGTGLSGPLQASTSSGSSAGLRLFGQAIWSTLPLVPAAVTAP